MEHYENNSRKILIGLIIGFFIGFSFGREGEKPPYNVWLEQGVSIKVVQKAGSYVYSYGRMSDGSYELISTLSLLARHMGDGWICNKCGKVYCPPDSYNCSFDQFAS